MANINSAVESDEARGPGVFRPEVVLALLRSFQEGDQEDEERALAELIQALDEDRPEGQKLFAPR